MASNFFHKTFDFIKAHPFGVAFSVFIIGLYFALRSRSAPASADAGNYYQQTSNAQAAEIQAGTQLQAIQLQAQTESNKTNAEANVAMQQIAGQVTIANLQSQVAINNNNQQAAVQTHADDLSAQTTQLVSSLQAQVANAQTTASVTEAQIQATAYTTINAQNTAAQIAIASAPYQSADYIAMLNEKAYEASQPGAAALSAINAQITGLTGSVNAISTNLANNTAADARQTKQVDDALAAFAYNLPSNTGQINIVLPTGTTLLSNTKGATVAK